MKISDGNWLIQENLAVLNPCHVYEIESTGSELTAYVAQYPVKARENQIDIPLITFHFFSPREGIIGVRMEHFTGIYPKTPEFSLQRDQAVTVHCVNDAKKASLSSGPLSVEIDKEKLWQVDFMHEGQRITGSGTKSAGYASDRKLGTKTIFDRLDLSVGEVVYGLGEHFTSFVKNGQAVETWNRDGGTSTEQAYKNIPFYVTNQGYGVFINDPGNVSFEVASEKVSKVQFSVPGEMLEYYVIAGPTLKQVLGRYTGLTGRPALPPAWSFGLWLSTSFTTNYDEATVNHFIDGMKERQLPVHVFHFDCFWMKGLHWCDFTWDKDVFPEPAAMLMRLKEKGLKICVWINPYISQQSHLFKEGMDHHYFITNKAGNVWQWDKWQPGQAIVDFTNPAACRWYTDCLRKLMAIGVDCFKTDFGERIPTDVVYYDGSDPLKMHNYYAYLYNKVVYDVLKEIQGEKEAVVFARSASVGSQMFPVHWGGDCYGTYESMAESLRGGLSIGLSGFGFWSHDIGGFENTAPAHVYKRWCAFGLLSSHSRLHGSKSYRIPWAYDEEAVDVLRFFTNWKCRLMPYLYQMAVLAATQGLPMMRAMVLEFQEDLGCESLDRQYMLGDSILVAPVFREDGKVSVYLPKGQWTHLFTGENVSGAGWRNEIYDFKSLPIYIKENTLLAIGANEQRPDYDYLAGLELHLFELQDDNHAFCVIRDLTGAISLEVRVVRAAAVCKVIFSKLIQPCVMVVHGYKKIKLDSTLAGEVEIKADRILVKEGIKEFSFIIEDI
ncbi:alpha-D-xyloside xylohydrolase [Propionispira arboris]|uniref:alpha-D-xyloside xylohydrolase n=1 Tax=Propionispira arboris TaxID=84035 RepID=A0A1H6W0Z6_9FIRM|nr:alpha-xylosidase [Propionispira arboris]SEJ06172.1 alpha-D-xyloside xylohydrolase [Propionispira arboris]